MTRAQSAISLSGAQAYREKLFNLVAGRDPIDVMEQTGSTLADIVGRHPAAVLRARPFDGKWTPNEIIGHLTDSEWVYGYRLRLILSEDDPAILGTEQPSGSGFTWNNSIKLPWGHQRYLWLGTLRST